MIENMKQPLFLLALSIFINGCAFKPPQFMQDQLQNQYFEKKIYADLDAYYVGAWTGATGPALTAIKILGDGNIKMCASNEYFGSINGKVFREDGNIKMIFESGSQYEIGSLIENHLLVSIYDQEHKYYSGKVPDRCKPIFSDFR